MKKTIGVFNVKIGERTLIEIGYGYDSDDFYKYINKIKMSDLQKHKIDMSYVSWIIKCKYYHNKDMIQFMLVVKTKDNKYCKYGKRCTNIQCIFDHSDTWKFDCKYKTLIMELCNLYKMFSEDHIKVGKSDFEYV